MKPSLFVRLLVALGCGVLAAPLVFAQKTYRCGNTYQSYPCALSDGKSGAVKLTDSASEKKAAPASSAAPAKPETPARDTATAAKATAAPQMSEEEKKLAAAKAAEAEAEKRKAAVAAEKKNKCDRIKNDLNYNTAQLRSGGSQTTRDRLNAERRQLNDSYSRESCHT